MANHINTPDDQDCLLHEAIHDFQCPCALQRHADVHRNLADSPFLDYNLQVPSPLSHTRTHTTRDERTPKFQRVYT